MNLTRCLGLALWTMGSLACSDENGVTQTQEPVQECQCPLTVEVDNLAICAAKSSLTQPPRVYSTAQTDGKASCEDDDGKFPHRVPTAPWTKVRIASPCAGSGKLCFSLRQGSAEAPSETDCVLAERCVDFAYETADAGLVELDPVAGWTVTDHKCALLYEERGGYLEFHAEDSEIGCRNGLEGALRTQTCPVECGETPNSAACQACSDEGLAEEL